LMLNREWLDNSMITVVEEFLAWQAPWLLLLQDMKDTTRDRLESVACCQARRMAVQRRLYPKIINRERVDAALVEAALRSANEFCDKDCEQISATYHIAGQYY